MRLLAMRLLGLCAVLLLVGCGKSHKAEHARRGPKKAPPAAAAAVTTVATPPAAAAPDADDEGDEGGDDSGGAVLLPDSEPAGSPFASTVAAAVAEVTQGQPAPTVRIYRAAYEQARRTITQDNVYDRLRQLERQIDAERQDLP
jgi:hypothetical protein